MSRTAHSLPPADCAACRRRPLPPVPVCRRRRSPLATMGTGHVSALRPLHRSWLASRTPGLSHSPKSEDAHSLDRFFRSSRRLAIRFQRRMAAESSVVKPASSAGAEMHISGDVAEAWAGVPNRRLSSFEECNACRMTRGDRTLLLVRVPTWSAGASRMLWATAVSLTPVPRLFHAFYLRYTRHLRTVGVRPGVP